MNNTSSPQDTLQQNGLIQTETLIVGFGFSAIPLVRELVNENREFTIISGGKSIWEKLDEIDRLDFDLVSSKHTSYYSFELVNHDTTDNFPTSKEFTDFQRKYQKQYEKYVTRDWVTEIKNYEDYSIVHTKSGKRYQAKHVIISTAFRRKMNNTIQEFDFEAAENKTVVLTSFGDSGNLIAAKLVPRNARVIVASNGFLCLDKFFFYRDQSYTLDQLETHNVRHFSKFIYKVFIAAGQNIASILPRSISTRMFGESLYIKYPLSDRMWKFQRDFAMDMPSPIPNGMIAVKYWPIDAFQKLFDGDNLKQHIKDGYLLNDIGFFVDQGMVELWPKIRTEIDHEAKVIRWGDKEIAYDFLLEGDQEQPNLPSISIESTNGESREYQYEYRHNYMGVIPKELNNIYLLGYTRPTTGGIANIIEMQCLFIHKLITDAAFHKEMHKDIEAKLAAYIREYYGSTPKKPTDHVVYYGFYTDDLATLIGINSTVKDCRSLKEVLQYYSIPNNAFKYRQEGPYKVEGTKEMVQQIWKDHKGFSFLRQFMRNFFLTQLTAMIFLIWVLPFYLWIPLCLIQLINPLMPLIQANGTNIHPQLNLILLLGLAASWYFWNPWILALTLFITFSLTFIARKMGWTRVFFNDLKNKKNYKEFYERYREAYNEINGVFTKKQKADLDHVGLIQNQSDID